METNIRNGLRNGFVYGLVFFTLSFLLGTFTFNAPLQKTLMMSAIIGALAWIVNGAMQSRFTKSLKKLQDIIFISTATENTMLDGIANHTIDEHLVSGKLFLTDKRLVFIWHEQKEYAWDLLTLQPFHFYPSIFNSGGEFILKDHADNKLVFEVDEIKAWKKALLNK